MKADGTFLSPGSDASDDEFFSKNGFRRNWEVLSNAEFYADSESDVGS